MTSAPPPSEPLIGKVLQKRYRVTRFLARGAMGAVYEAMHEDLGKRVAVKVLKKSKVTPELETRFRREARAASKLDCEHIASVVDAGLDADVGLFLVMEYLEGEDLETRLARDKKLSLAKSIRIANEVALALSVAHSASIIHRDLKPANIFLCQKRGDERAKLLDFGISKTSDAVIPAAGSDVTIEGSLVGTVQYVAPELIAGRPASPASDLWSLGAVMYEMLSGRCAYEDTGSAHDVLIRIATTNPPPLSVVAPDVPSVIGRFVAQAMQRNPEARFQKVADFLSNLKAAADQVGELASLDPLTPDGHLTRSHCGACLRQFHCAKAPADPLGLSQSAAQMRSLSSFATSPGTLSTVRNAPQRDSASVVVIEINPANDETIAVNVDSTRRRVTPWPSDAPRALPPAASPPAQWSPLAIAMLSVGVVLLAVAAWMALRG